MSFVRDAVMTGGQFRTTNVNTLFNLSIMSTRILSAIVLALTSGFAAAQGEWTQALQSSSPELEGGTVTRICPDNGLVSIGYYRNEAIFGEDTLAGGFLHQNVVFVVKHSEAGTVEWTHRITNTDPDDWVFGRGLDVDADGNIIVGGTGIDTILVDGEYASHTSNQQGTESMFIIKFSPTGTVLWSVDVESTAFGSELMSLAVDPSNNVWLCGPISSSASKAFKLNGATGIEMVETGVISGQVRHIDTDADGNVYLRGQSLNSFTLNSVTCPVNNVLGGNTTNWTGKLNTDGIAQWFHVPDQGHLGFSPWHLVNQAVTSDGRCYVEANDNMMIDGDTISEGANDKGLYFLNASGTPVWWMRLNRTGMLEVEDMSTDPFGNCWITGTATGVLDLLDTVVEHTGFFAFHIGPDGHIIQRVFGPPVLHTYTVDVADGLAVFAGEYSTDISFGDHAIEENLRGLFVARYAYASDVSIAEVIQPTSVHTFPNPAQHEVRLSGVPDRSITVRVLNTMGQELRRWDRFNAQNDALDLSGLPAGALFLQVNGASFGTIVQVLHVH
jgi:hypothetical protein